MSADNDRNNVERCIHMLADAWNASDAAAFGALFTEEADYVASDGTWHKGRQTIVDMVHKALPASRVSVYGSITQRFYGNVAKAVFGWISIGDSRRGTITCLLVNSQGNWLIDSLHNTDVE
jgi:uncharacterized protein (TIGR02246 family)